MERMILIVDTTVLAVISMIVMRGVSVLELLLRCNRDASVNLSCLSKDISHLDKRLSDIEEQQHLHCD